MDYFNIHHIGARSGTIGFPKLKPLHDSITCTAYDADINCCPQIKENLSIQGYSNVEVIQKGIGQSRKAKFNLAYDPNSSSLFETNDYFSDYYIESPDFDRIQKEAHKKVEELSLDLIPLDSINLKFTIDFLSLDTQGSELDILKSAKNSLDKTIGIYTEVNFAPLYEGIPLYGDVSNYLDKLGFQLINIDLQNGFAPRNLPVGFRLNKMVNQGDALFLKKPELINSELERRKLIFAAIAFGQLEFAASCINDLKINQKYPKNTWQFAVNRFLETVSGIEDAMPKTFSQKFSKAQSFERFSNASLKERKKVIQKMKKIKSIVFIVRFLRGSISKIWIIRKYLIKSFLYRFTPPNRLELLYMEIGQKKLANALRKKRFK